VLIASGIAFCYLVVLPRALTFLVDFDSDLYATQIRASYYLSFVALTLFAFGLAFQMPIFVLALVRIGALTSGRLRRNRRIGYVLMLVFAILLPTVDPVSLALEVAPLLVLYEMSIWLSVLMERRWERAAAEADAR
jgi:sec-independent protein translocase protein TatC